MQFWSQGVNTSSLLLARKLSSQGIISWSLSLSMIFMFSLAHRCLIWLIILNGQSSRKLKTGLRYRPATVLSVNPVSAHLLTTGLPLHHPRMSSHDKGESSRRRGKSYRGCTRCKYYHHRKRNLLTMNRIGVRGVVVLKVWSHKEGLQLIRIERPTCSNCEKAGVECQVISLR